MNSSFRRISIVLLLLTVRFGSTPAVAQLSPGRLAQPHAELDSNQQCLTCHQTRRGVDPQRCLSCHAGLGERISANLGLHAGPKYRACQNCHVDHQGRNFDLIWWGEQGKEAFDHSNTGWPLSEPHAQTPCSDCHSSSLITEQKVLRLEQGTVSRESTFLGLATECAACHADPHYGQFSAKVCTDCHQEQSFSEAVFNHDSSRFPLTGHHLEVECAACHRRVEKPSNDTSRARRQRVLVGFDSLAADPHYTRYTDLPHAECSACHDDPHANRFGPSCSTCHSTRGWSSFSRTAFNHSLTNYPLVGKHRSLACESCHLQGFTLAKPSFSTCSDCHQDTHQGQLATAAGVRACDECHTVQGFTPSTFGSSEHQATSFPLTGAHLDTTCEQCHQELGPADLATAISKFGGLPATSVNSTDRKGRIPSPLFLLTHQSCLDCHQDPHQATYRAVPPCRCTSCHDTEAWWSVAFQHRSTGFLLQGGHAGLECSACHQQESPTDNPNSRIEEADVKGLLFSPVPTECEDCHKDPHNDQFATERPGAMPEQPQEEEGRTDRTAVFCERCHSVQAFVPSTFDHQNDSRFPLEGAHSSVPCGECHREQLKAPHRILYRPLARDCASCHDDGASRGSHR